MIPGINQPDNPAVDVLYTSKNANTITKGMLLHYDAEQKEWGTLPYRSKVNAGEQLACPQPLDAVFSVAKTDCEVTRFDQWRQHHQLAPLNINKRQVENSRISVLIYFLASGSSVTSTSLAL